MTTLSESLSHGVDTLMDRTVAPGFSKVGLALRRRLPDWPHDPAPGALSGRTAAVTGATSGLGLATAEGLARLGAEVRLVVRDVDRGARVRARLQAAVPSAQVSVHGCDVSDLDDVRRLVEEISLDRLDVLVHNAGAMPPRRTESQQGHEMTMALHVLGPVLMTELLRPALRGRDSRVLFVTSGGMYGQRLRADDPEYQVGAYSPTTAYARSKRAQVELLPVLTRRWAAERIGVHGSHPGWADTPGVADSLPTFYRLTRPLLRDAEGGADTTLWLSASQPQPSSGRLWHDRRARPTHMMRRTRTDEAESAELWDWVRAQIGIETPREDPALGAGDPGTGDPVSEA